MSIALQRAFSVVGRPSYVKVAAEQPYVTGYPCDSREATFVSYVRATQDGVDTSEIRKMAAFWDIEADIQNVDAKWNEATAVKALQDRHYAMVQSYGGNEIKKYAAYDLDSTLESGNAFYANRIRYPLAWREKTAATLMARGETHGVRFPEVVDRYLQKAAGLGYPTEESVQEIVLSRMNSVSHKHRDTVLKFASVIGDIGSHPLLRYNDAIVKEAVEAVAAFDTATGLVHCYGNIPLPEDMLVTLESDIRKTAAAETEVTLVNGKVLKLASISSDVLRAVDEGLAKLSAADLEEVLPTLPKPDADLLVRLLA